MEVYCNECNSDFKIDYKSEQFESGVINHYFKCPYCGEKYNTHQTKVNEVLRSAKQSER